MFSLSFVSRYFLISCLISSVMSWLFSQMYRNYDSLTKVKTHTSAISPMSNGKWTVSEREESVWLNSGIILRTSWNSTFRCSSLWLPLDDFFSSFKDLSVASLKKRKKESLNPLRSQRRRQNLLLFQGVWQQWDDFHIKNVKVRPQIKTKISAVYGSSKRCRWRPSGDKSID